LRDRLKEGILARLDGVRCSGSETQRLPHMLHVRIEGVSSESMVLGLDAEGIAVGIGSACNAKAMRPSHVLKALGLSDEQAAGALVLSLGMHTTEGDIDACVEALPKIAARLRRVTAMTIGK
jgi:cysteine desulfurase